MRAIISICVLILGVGAFALWKTAQLPTSFGEFTGAPEAPVVDLIERPKDFLGKTVLVTGLVRRQCKSMGCFFFFHTGDKSLRIDLEEIAMNAPMKEGHLARVEGQIISYRDGYQLFASAVEFK
jgi:hypothetical protein